MDKRRIGMKKLAVMMAVLAIMTMVSVVGCCTLMGPDGVETKSFSNCLQTVQTIACNPPASVLSMLTGVIEITKLGIATFAPGSAEFVAAVQANAAANALLAGVCISIAQLNDLTKFVESAAAKSLSVKMMAKAGPMKAKALDAQPLIDWRDSFKK
jgi:hypothetical protein